MLAGAALAASLTVTILAQRATTPSNTPADTTARVVAAAQASCVATKC